MAPFHGRTSYASKRRKVTLPNDLRQVNDNRAAAASVRRATAANRVARPAAGLL